MSRPLLHGPDFEGEIAVRQQENINAVLNYVQGIGSKSHLQNFDRRVKSFCREFGFDRQEVLKEIQSHEMFRATFAMDPRRQGIDEKIFESWLKSLPQTSNVEKLSSHGKNAVYVSTDGFILRGAAIEGAVKPSKSLDFIWKTGSTTFYAMHKRTTGDAGGAQGSARKEMESILRNFLSCSQLEIALVLVLDGNFWTNSRLEQLKNDTRDKHPKSFAVRSSGLLEVLTEYE